MPDDLGECFSSRDWQTTRQFYLDVPIHLFEWWMVVVEQTKTTAVFSPTYKIHSSPWIAI